MSGEIFERPDHINHWLWWGSKPVFWVGGKLLFRLRSVGREHIPKRGPVLIVSNHCSFLDPVLLGITVPRVVRFLARSTLWDVPVVGWWIGQWGAVPVYRESKAGTYSAVRKAVDVLKKGYAVCIFPEGTRSPDGRFQIEKVRTGVGFVALHTRCQIVPAAVIGSHRALSKGEKWIRPVPIVVRFGPAFSLQEFSQHNSISRKTGESVTAKIVARIIALLPDEQKPPGTYSIEER